MKYQNFYQKLCVSFMFTQFGKKCYSSGKMPD